VKWKGFRRKSNMWVAEADISAKELLQRWRVRNTSGKAKVEKPAAKKKKKEPEEGHVVTTRETRSGRTLKRPARFN